MGVSVPTLAALCRALGPDLEPVTELPVPDVVVGGVHVSELIDPTPYLQGGELLLTTGLGLTGQIAQAHAYVARLARRGVVGLGLGLGPIHERVPRTLTRACEEAGLVLLVVPAPTPFLMVARTYWNLLAQAGQAELSAALGAHRDLVRAAAGPSPVPAVVRTLAGAVEGWAAHLNSEGEVLEVWPRARRASARQIAGEVSRLRAFGPHSSSTFPIEGDDVVLQPLSSRGRLTGYVATGCPRPMRPPDQQLLLAACSLLALQGEQHRRGTTGPRSARACVTRLVTTGYLDAARSLSGDLGLRALPPSVRILAVVGLGEGRGDDLLDAVEQAVLQRRTQVLAMAGSDDVWVLLSDGDVEAVLNAVRRFISSVAHQARAVVSALVPLTEVSRSTALLEQALTVLEPGRLRDMAEGNPGNVGVDLLDLGPIIHYPRADLLRSVVAYLRHRGRWEDATRDLGIHRNTLRHRIGTAGRVMGADLDDPDVASRLWLSLRAAGLA
jgi:PucR family transcriptional regulator, purine catabolism regulatory protein